MVADNTQEDFLSHYLASHDRLGRYVHSMVWHTEDARDLISETILIAYESFHKIKNREAFAFYLFGIASRLIKKKWKQKERYTTLDDYHWEYLGDLKGKDDDNSNDDLYRLLNYLPVKYRECLVLFEISGFSIKEIAEMQGKTLSGIKSRLVRARQMMTKLCEKEQAYLTQYYEKSPSL